MSYPNFPNPARRARILEAHQLRQQGLTLREIAKIMGCAHSTVAGYLRDYELFRVDLMRELAADQIVSHAIQLAEVDSEHHDRRLAAMREFRLLLTALPEIRRDEDDRTRELTSGQVHVDRYGNRYATPNRMFPPTQEGTAGNPRAAARTPRRTPRPRRRALLPTPPRSHSRTPTNRRTGRPHGRPRSRPTTRTTNPTRSEQNRTNPNKNPPKSSPGRQIQRSRPKSPRPVHPRGHRTARPTAQIHLQPGRLAPRARKSPPPHQEKANPQSPTSPTNPNPAPGGPNRRLTQIQTAPPRGGAVTK